MLPTLGFSMILKNGASTLRTCLGSVGSLVSEMIIGDTGSTDGSQEIAREFGATVLDVPWESDFAKARNTALARCTTDWVLTLDADEELDADAINTLPGQGAFHGQAQKSHHALGAGKKLVRQNFFQLLPDCGVRNCR